MLSAIDLPRALSVAEVTSALELQTLGGRKWFVSGTCATTGEGLYEGLDWLSNVRTLYALNLVIALDPSGTCCAVIPVRVCIFAISQTRLCRKTTCVVVSLGQKKEKSPLTLGRLR